MPAVPGVRMQTYRGHLASPSAGLADVGPRVLGVLVWAHKMRDGTASQNFLLSLSVCLSVSGWRGVTVLILAHPAYLTEASWRPASRPMGLA